MPAMFNQRSIFYLLPVNRHLCLKLTTVGACSDSTNELFISPLARAQEICHFIIRFLFLWQEQCGNACVCVGGSFIRGTSSGQLVIFVVNSCSRLLSLASRVNKQTVCGVNLAGCLNIVGSVMFLKVKLYLTQPVFLKVCHFIIAHIAISNNGQTIFV